ncbi:type II toxin-antitoxin system VapC family toxin [Sphingobacterium sp. DN00404]|uniref:Type II toxin-antitoxin system VapC family toxin n=1 Tax=Sphingobacterium micropteri TaxID=2763501 RepID=A0ABR7YNJ9_9SPHI|nr:type II toxin-antitoxin system VapC family toxin [Sphingobacterium micropteri]MBD1432895.1 type II toxin-antitoxin system VapC family toxin [Sphingobacterium micropteri]
MARYILDTNILAFFVSGEYDNISPDVAMILGDHANQLYVSSVSVTELLQLYRIGKIKPKQYKTTQQLQDAIQKDFYIKILAFGEEHTKTLSRLDITGGHNDPFDHAIISHAITEKLTLISSDRKFEDYTSQNLKFVFNKR